MKSTVKYLFYVCHIILAVYLTLAGAESTENLNISQISKSGIPRARPEAIDKEIRSDSEVVILRSAKTDGCWDASCGVSIGHHPFVNPHFCDWSIKYFQWWFAGPTLRSFDCDGNQQCLVCYGGSENCTVETTHCTGNPDQKWFLKSQPSQGSHSNGQIRFSIYSEKYPTNCVTLYDVHGEGPIHLKLQPCDTVPRLEQSFYIDSDGFGTVKSVQDRKQSENYGTSGCPNSTIGGSRPIGNKSFVCTSTGRHADTDDCKVFHECISNNSTSNPNEFTHLRFTCGENTVYCLENQICDWEENCPCGQRTKYY